MTGCKPSGAPVTAPVGCVLISPLVATPTALAIGAFTILGAIKSNSETRKLSEFLDMDFCGCMRKPLWFEPEGSFAFSLLRFQSMSGQGHG